MPFAAPSIVAAPQVIPSTASLLVGADVVDHNAGDDAWLAGYRWAPELCADLDVWIENCAVVPMQKPGGHNRPAPGEAEPFMVIARDECSTWGWQTAEYEARARRALTARESEAAERELWTGALLPGNNNLAQPDATVLNGGAALGFRDALVQLTQALPTVGIIHARPGLVEQWWGAGLLQVVQGKLRTATGHFVVAGYGYPGTGPNGEAATASQEWAYATDMMVVHRGAVTITPPLDGEDTVENRRRQFVEATDHTRNVVAFRAERPMGVVWSRCAHFAVLVNTQASGAGGVQQVSGSIATTTPPGTAVDVTDLAVDGTVGGVQLLAANPARKQFTVQNTGPADMRVTIDGTAPTATRGRLLTSVDTAGSIAHWSGPYCPQGAVRAIQSTAESTTAHASETTG